MGAWRAAAVVFLMVTTAALSACTAARIPIDDASSPPPRATVSPAAPTPEPRRTGTKTANPPIVPMVLEEDETDCYQQVFADPDNPERLGPWRLEVPRERGEKGYARGTAQYDSNGVPVSYTVAPNDNIDMIARRFCITPAFLQVINHVRRGDGALYAGDTLNLDPHAIFSVGDQNGVITENPLLADLHIPPQR